MWGCNMTFIGAIIFAIIVVGAFWLFFFLMDKWLDEGGPWKLITIVYTILVFSTLLYAVSQSPPCVQWDTMMQYNQTTKTVMPVRYCVQYGEWQ
jgi:hypothetical protein